MQKKSKEGVNQTFCNNAQTKQLHETMRQAWGQLRSTKATEKYLLQIKKLIDSECVSYVSAGWLWQDGTIAISPRFAVIAFCCFYKKKAINSVFL